MPQSWDMGQIILLPLRRKVKSSSTHATYFHLKKRNAGHLPSGGKQRRIKGKAAWGYKQAKYIFALDVARFHYHSTKNSP
jgi:hypothetical protein